MNFGIADSVAQYALHKIAASLRLHDESPTDTEVEIIVEDMSHDSEDEKKVMVIFWWAGSSGFYKKLGKFITNYTNAAILACQQSRKKKRSVRMVEKERIFSKLDSLVQKGETG